MANTTVNSSLKVKQWDDAFFTEYVRKNQFAAMMGTDENSIIQIKEQLTKMAGDRIVIPLVKKLSGAGVLGENTLEGNEEALVQYGYEIAISQLRNAVSIRSFQERLTEISIRDAAKTMLKIWAMETLRDDIIKRLASPNLDGVTTYANTSNAADRNAWLAANADRVFFGALNSNNASNVHATSLQNVDSADDKLTTALLSKVKRAAKTMNPKIRPVSVDSMGEFFVALAPSPAFRDLKNSTTMQQAMRDALVRGKDNPLFTDGDLVWDGVIVKEVPEIPVIGGAGASGIDVAPVYFMGAQALGLVWGQRTKTVTKLFDYDDVYGVAISEVRGVAKTMFNNKQHGMATVYVSGIADT